MISPSPSNYPTDDVRQIARFLLVFMGFSSIGGVVELIVGIISGFATILWLGVISIAGALILFVAWLLVRRGYIQLTMITMTTALLLLGVMIAMLSPDLFPILSIVPILVLAVALPYLQPRMTIIIAVIMVIGSVIIAATSLFVSLLPPLPLNVRSLLLLITVPLISTMTIVLVVQFRLQLSRSLEATRHANMALQEARASLETQVVERTAALQSALSEVELRAAEQAHLLAEVSQQRLAIRELSVPILPISHSTLVMPLVGALDTTRLQQMQQRALEAISTSRADRLLIDLTGVPVVDTQVAGEVLQLADAVRLLGARAVLIGIRPEVAQTIVGLGVDLRTLSIERDLSAAMLRGEGASLP